MAKTNRNDISDLLHNGDIGELADNGLPLANIKLIFNRTKKRFELQFQVCTSKGGDPVFSITKKIRMKKVIKALKKS